MKLNVMRAILIGALCLIAPTDITAVNQSYYDINLIGYVDGLGSLACHTSSFIECLQASPVHINLIKTRACVTTSFPDYFKRIVANGTDLTTIAQPNKYKRPLTGITVYTDIIYPNKNWRYYLSIPNKSVIKFAYCVTERSQILDAWVKMLNDNFDALLVPDEWLIDVYKNSGVKLPIFVLPEVLDLNHFLAKEPPKDHRHPFVFGFSGGFWPRKNHELLLRAFVEEFGNNPHVILRLHGRFGNYLRKILETFNQIKTRNVTLEHKALSRREFQNFLTSLDCYVTISKGEGFSIVPREVLAAGIPCIVSNNTAQTTICKSGCVYSVPSNIIEDSYHLKLEENFGHDFNCDIKDVRKALRDVYENYQHHRALAKQGREWVKQYLAENLKQKYCMLVQPKNVILGDCNEITNEYLMTDSQELFKRYNKLMTAGKLRPKAVRR